MGRNPSYRQTRTETQHGTRQRAHARAAERPHGTRPRGNGERDRGEVERSERKLLSVLGH
jgi:hypothetical protein